MRTIALTILCCGILSCHGLAPLKPRVISLQAASLVTEPTVIPSPWSAVRIASNEVSSGVDEAEAVGLFNTGESVLLVHNVVPDDECKAIVKSVRELGQGCNETRWKADLESQTMYRLPTRGAAERADATKTPYSGSLDDATDERCQRLFRRAIELIDATLPSLAQDLFGGPISGLLLDPDDLSFSSREPAVNIYTKGGPTKMVKN